MKILIFFLLTAVCFSQHTKKDSILSGGFVLDDTVYVPVDLSGAISDTSRTFDPTVPPAYQIYIKAVSERPDTLIVQQEILWGRGTNQNSAWTTMRVYNPSTSANPETLFIVQDFIQNSSFVSAEALLWSPFVGGRWRIIRYSPELGLHHRVYFDVYFRQW